MRKDRFIIIAALVVAAAATVSGCGPKYPEISQEQIRSDIVEKNVGWPNLGWKFGPGSPTEIEILESDYSGKNATVVLRISTGNAPGGLFNSKYAGRARLHYVWIAEEWIAVEVENLDFKELSRAERERIEREEAELAAAAREAKRNRAEKPLTADEEAQKETVVLLYSLEEPYVRWHQDQYEKQGRPPRMKGLAEFVQETSDGNIRRLLVDHFVPQFMDSLPDKDGWGHPIEYLMVGRTLAARSPGRDGVFSFAVPSNTYQNYEPYADNAFDNDIFFKIDGDTYPVWAPECAFNRYGGSNCTHWPDQ